MVNKEQDVGESQENILENPSIFFDRVMEVVNNTRTDDGEDRANNGRRFIEWLNAQWVRVDEVVSPLPFFEASVLGHDRTITMRRQELGQVVVLEYYNADNERDGYDAGDVVEVLDLGKRGFNRGMRIKFEVSHDDRSKIIRVEYSDTSGAMNDIGSKGTRSRTAHIGVFDDGQFSLQYSDSISGSFIFPKEFG